MLKINYGVLFFLLMFSNLTPLSAKESPYIPYVIQPGDTVSELLVKYQLSPLYGPRKWVERVLKLNRLTLESARHLEVGDVIVLPKRSFIYSEDQLHSLQSSIEREIVAKFYAPKKHNISLLTGYAFRQQTFSNTVDSADIKQVFSGSITYRYDSLKKRHFTWVPEVAATIITQSGSSFDQDTTLIAEFTPTIEVRSALELSWQGVPVSFVPQLTYSNFSTLDYRGDFLVKRETLIWGGVGVRKRWWFGRHYSELDFNVAKGDRFAAKKFSLNIRGLFFYHYELALTAARSELELNSRITTKDVGITIGYKF